MGGGVAVGNGVGEAVGVGLVDGEAVGAWIAAEVGVDYSAPQAAATAASSSIMATHRWATWRRRDPLESGRGMTPRSLPTPRRSCHYTSSLNRTMNILEFSPLVDTGGRALVHSSQGNTLRTNRVTVGSVIIPGQS